MLVGTSTTSAQHLLIWVVVPISGSGRVETFPTSMCRTHCVRN